MLKNYSSHFGVERPTKRLLELNASGINLIKILNYFLINKNNISVQREASGRRDGVKVD
jgi:hypothetical protein